MNTDQGGTIAAQHTKEVIKMKAIFTYTDIYGEHKELVDVAPIDDNFEIVDESDIYIDLDNEKNTYHYSDLEFID